MRVHVTMEIVMDDDVHPDHAARLIDKGLWQITQDGAGDKSLLGWATVKVEEK